MPSNPFPRANRKPDVYRPNAHKRGYDRHWQKVRANKVRQSPLCEQCLAVGLTVRVDEVHHKDGNPMNNEPDNLESLCRPCHEKTKR
jgi:5-methylcytosine-specific restriction protein A